MDPPPFPVFSAWMRSTYGDESDLKRASFHKHCLLRKSRLDSQGAQFPCDKLSSRPSLSSTRTWAFNHRESFSKLWRGSGKRPKSFSIPPILPEPDDPETAHNKRRLSLLSRLPDLASTCQDVHSEINDICQDIRTPAFDETRNFWLSMSIRYSQASLEATNMKTAIETLDIHRLSSYWTRAWRALYEQRQSICMTREILKELRVDDMARTYGTAGSQGLIDGFQVQFFRYKVRNLAQHCTGAAERLRNVNMFAFGEHKRPIRQAQWVKCEVLSGTLERMAMRRLVPPTLQRRFGH